MRSTSWRRPSRRRRSVVVLSDGVDVGSSISAQSRHVGPSSGTCGSSPWACGRARSGPRRSGRWRRAPAAPTPRRPRRRSSRRSTGRSGTGSPASTCCAIDRSRSRERTWSSRSGSGVSAVDLHVQDADATSQSRRTTAVLDRFWSSGASVAFVATRPVRCRPGRPRAPGLLRSSLDDLGTASPSSRPSPRAPPVAPRRSRSSAGGSSAGPSSSLARTRRWPWRFREELEIADFPFSAEQCSHCRSSGCSRRSPARARLAGVLDLRAARAARRLLVHAARAAEASAAASRSSCRTTCRCWHRRCAPGTPSSGRCAVVAESAEEPARREFNRVRRRRAARRAARERLARRCPTDGERRRRAGGSRGGAAAAHRRQHGRGPGARRSRRSGRPRPPPARPDADRAGADGPLGSDGAAARDRLIFSLLNPHSWRRSSRAPVGQVALAIAALMVVAGR